MQQLPILLLLLLEIVASGLCLNIPKLELKKLDCGSSQGVDQMAQCLHYARVGYVLPTFLAQEAGFLNIDLV